ncbi:protein ELYS-like [Phaenicophaeus curvirostris]|uniref:protein ELYS-like n=1 Tax=Phaenicophaeus curvirostris TaxID=33595 RepID=UPI0037F0BDF5
MYLKKPGLQPLQRSLDHLRHQETMEVAPWLQMRIIQSLACQGQHRQALTHLRNVKPSVSMCSEVRLCLSVLLSNRCVEEAWDLLRQHATEVNREELLKHIYERCQEMGLVEDLLKLPFTNTELECLKSILRTRARIPTHAILSVRNQQSACYRPTDQQNQSMKVNLTSSRTTSHEKSSPEYGVV